MLRNVLLIATKSGLPLFSQAFLNSVAQPRLVGSLLTIMMELSIRTTKNSVAYIELANLAVTILKDETVQVCCALFHDRSDGPALGKLVARQILFAFLEEYSGDFASLACSVSDGGGIGEGCATGSDGCSDDGSGGGGGGGGGVGISDGGIFSSNLRDFRGFRMKISRVVTGCVRPVLGQLQAHASGAILKALLVMEEGAIQSSGGSSGDSRVNQLALLANLQAVLHLATELLAGHRDDTCGQVVLDTGPIGCFHRSLSFNKKGSSPASGGFCTSKNGHELPPTLPLPQPRSSVDIIPAPAETCSSSRSWSRTLTGGGGAKEKAAKVRGAGGEREDRSGGLLRTRTTACRIGRALFVMIVDKDVPYERYKDGLDEAERMLAGICAIISENHLMRRE